MRQSIVAKRSPERPRGFWVRLVRQWETSGASQQSSADAAGVSVYTLRYWIAKLRAEEQPLLSQQQHRDFIEVTGVRVEARPAAGACRIHVGERVVLELPALPPVEWLRALSTEG